MRNRKSAGGFIWRFKGDPVKSLCKENNNRKKVKCTFPDGTNKQWNSMKEAMEEFGISRYKLQKYCNKNGKDNNGNKWEFI